MTTAPDPAGPTATASPSRRGREVWAVAGIVFLTAVCAIPVVAALASPEYHQETRRVVTIALSASTLPTLVLAVAASVRRGTALLLVASGVTVVHLVGAVALWAALGPGGEVARRAVIQLLGVAVGLGVAWWRTRDRRVGAFVPPAIIVAVLLAAVLAPVAAEDFAWWAVLAPYRLRGVLPTLGILAVALLLGLVGRDARAGSASPGNPAVAPRRPDWLPTAAILVLAAVTALDVPALFAQGPGIRPGGAGPVVLVINLAVAASPAALVLAAGAATSGRRGLLVTASVAAGALGAVFAAVGMAGARPRVAPLILGLAGAVGLAWAAQRSGVPGPAVRTGLGWAAAALAVVAALPWDALFSPEAAAYRTDPRFWGMFVQPHLPALGAVAAAALLGAWRRWARIAAAAVLVALVVGDLAALADHVTSARRVAVLDALRLAGHLTACLLAVVAARVRRTPPAAVSASGG